MATYLRDKHVISRPNDYVYDPVFTVSSAKDHYKAVRDAAIQSLQFAIRPNYSSMFSDLPKHPRIQYIAIEDSNRLPNFMDTRWSGCNKEQVRNTSKHMDIIGCDRYKFFQRPKVQKLQIIMPILEIPDTSDKTPSPHSVQEIPDRLKQKTRATQTMYRESSAQTSPWEPPSKVIDGSEPEILTLQYLSWKQGLPAGMYEVEMIERARIKRAWEKVMPPLVDEASFNMRRNMIEDFERNEWAFREEELKKIHELRLELVRKILGQIHHDLSDRAQDRLARSWIIKQEEKEKKLKALNHTKRRELRKIEMKHKGDSGKYKPKTVIDEHRDFKSELYGPIERFGENPKRRFEEIVSKDIFLKPSDVKGVDLLPNILSNIHVDEKKLKLKYRTLCIRETKWTRHNLNKLHMELKELRLSCGPKKKRSGLRVRITRPPPPPATPQLENISDVDEEMHQASIFIQKIIRGRAAQTIIWEARDRNRELIDEIKSTHALQYSEWVKKNNESFEIRNMQRKKEMKELDESKVTDMFKHLEGNTLATMLDFLNKEMFRLQQERRAHAYVLLATRERNRREAAEAGRRQYEERRRREHDEVFKQVVKIHQDTVDMYLEDIIKEGMEDITEEEATKYIKELAGKIDDAAYEALNRTDYLEQEEMTADLVHHFVLPEVEKELVRKKLRNKQQKYLQLAHSIVYDKLEEIPIPKAPAVSREESIKSEEDSESLPKSLSSSTNPSGFDSKSSESLDESKEIDDFRSVTFARSTSSLPHSTSTESSEEDLISQKSTTSTSESLHEIYYDDLASNQSRHKEVSIKSETILCRREISREEHKSFELQSYQKSRETLRRIESTIPFDNIDEMQSLKSKERIKKVEISVSETVEVLSLSDKMVSSTETLQDESVPGEEEEEENLEMENTDFENESVELEETEFAEE